MKLTDPMNVTNKILKPANHLLHSTMVSSCLALLACTTLAPNPQKPAANYIDPKARMANGTIKDSDPGYEWFY
jgi:hypothetical protein